MIQCEQASLRYPVSELTVAAGRGSNLRQPEVLRDLNFSFPQGSFHYLTGVSGAGKSSLLKMIYLSLMPTSGNLHVLGQNARSLKDSERAALRRKIGVVFQDYRLLDRLNVEDNVALPLKLAGTYSAKRRSDILDLLTWVGLGDHLTSYPKVLSGGQKQRVALARAVITRPKMLLADEPTGNLDDGMGARLIYLFEELNRLGTGVVIATHSTPLVARFPHPVFHLYGGSGQAMSAAHYLTQYSDDAPNSNDTQNFRGSGKKASSGQPTSSRRVGFDFDDRRSNGDML